MIGGGISGDNRPEQGRHFTKSDRIDVYYFGTKRGHLFDCRFKRRQDFFVTILHKQFARDADPHAFDVASQFRAKIWDWLISRGRIKWIVSSTRLQHKRA